MADVLHARARRGDGGGEVGEAARAIADRRVELDETAVDRERVLDDAREHQRIDVSAAEQKDDLLAREILQFIGEERCERGGAGPLHHAVLHLDEAQDRKRDRLLVDGDHAVDAGPRELERTLADFRHGQAVGERRLHLDSMRRPVCERAQEARGALRLDADHADLGPKRLDGDSDARDQPPAADRNDHGVEVRDLLEDLETDGSRARDDGCVVEAVDIGEAFVGDELVGEVLRLGDVRAVDQDARAELAATRLLHERRDLGHHDRHGDAEVARVPGERERVVARAGRHDAAGARCLRKLQKRVARAALLEAAGALLVLELDEDLAAGQPRKRRRVDARRALHASRDPASRSDDVVERHILARTRRAHAVTFCAAPAAGEAAFAASSAFRSRST